MELPQRPESLAELLQIMKDRGFKEDFNVKKEGMTCSSGSCYPETDVTIVEHHRFEGTSNPDDMAVVYGVKTKDGKQGVVVDAFGVYSDPIVSEFMKSVEKHKSSGSQHPGDEIKPAETEKEISKDEESRRRDSEKE